MKGVFCTIILIVACFLCVESKAQKGTKVAYEFPAEMAEAIRAQYEKYAEKGLALYQITCAKCHGKKDIPDFTIEQLELYQIRVANATHESELQDNTVNAEELALITTFFMYKKKSGKSMAKRK